MTYTYKTKGVCAQQIQIKVESGIIEEVKFLGGCSGNTQGVARLAEGQKIEDVISKLKGIRCGFKQTSCPDQLANALSEILANKE